jgi:Carboxylesterase family
MQWMIPHHSSGIRYVTELWCGNDPKLAVTDLFEQSLDLAWRPLVDGRFLTDEPQKLVLRGQVPDIPFITSDCDDEGTLFALYSVNITQVSE